MNAAALLAANAHVIAYVAALVTGSLVSYLVNFAGRGRRLHSSIRKH